MDSITGGGSPRRSTRRRTGLACSIVLGGAALALAQWAGSATATECAGATITWDGGAGTTAWGTAQNWTEDRLPGATDRACIPSLAGVTVVHASGTTSVASVEVSGALTLSGGSFSVTDAGQASSVWTLTLSGATLGGAGTVDVGNAMTWTGGRMSGTGTTHIASGASLSIPNSGTHLYLDAGRTLSNDGTATFAASSGYGVYAYDDVVVRNAGTWTITGGTGSFLNSLASGNPPVFRNLGTGLLRRTSGTAGFALGVRVANDGVVDTLSGSITLNGGDDGSAHSGTFGTGVSLSGGSYTLSGATLFGTTMNGATVTASGPVTVAPGATTTLSAGVLGGTGTVDVTGPFLWSGGRMSGTGTTHVASGATLSIANSLQHVYLDAGRQLSNDGTVAMTTASGYQLYAAGDVVVGNAGLWTVGGTTSTGLQSNAVSGAAPVFRNLAGAVVRRVSGTPSMTFGVRFANDGLAEALTGSIVLTGGDDGSAHSGTFGTGTQLSGGTFTLNGGTLYGAALNGATVVASGPVTLPAGATSTLSSGVLGGAGTVEVEGSLAWTGGRMSGTGTTHVASGASLAIGNSSQHVYLDAGRQLSNDGTVAMTTSSGYQLYAAGDVVVRNAGTWTVNGTTSTGLQSNTVSGAAPVFRNLAGAVVRRVSGTPSMTFGVRFANDGLAEALTGSIVLTGGDDGAAHSGTFGTGTQLSSGTFTLSGAELNGTAMNGATVIASGTLTLSGGTSLSAGSLGGAGTVEVANTLTWSNGHLAGTGTTHVAPGATLAIANTSGHVYLDAGRQLSNDGTVAVTSGNGYQLYAAGDVVVRNAGTWTYSGTISTGVQSNAVSGAAPVFRNLTGALVRRTSGSATTTFAVRFANDGVVDALAGSVALTGGDDGAAHSGTFGSSTQLGGGTFTLSGAELNGTAMNGATVAASGTLTLSGAVSLSGGGIAGAGTVEVAGTLTWSNGVMSGTGTTHVAPGATLSLANTSTHLYLAAGRQLSNDGTVAVATTNGYQLYAAGDVVVRNAGTWTYSSSLSTGLQSNAVSGAAPVFRNLTGALVRKVAGAGTATFGVRFANDGVVDALTGSVALTGGDDGVAHSGTFGSSTQLGGGTFTLSDADLDGTAMNGATVVATGPVNLSGATSLSAGSLGGTGTVEVAGTLTWSNGVMSGTGTTHVGSGSALSIANTSTHLYLAAGRQLSNDGTVAVATTNGYQLYAAGDVVVRNAGTWTYSSTIGTGLQSNATSGAAPVFRNLTGALVRKVAGAGTASFGVRFANDGVVDALTGSVALTGGDDGAAHGGTFGAGTQLSGGTFTLSGATLSGTVMNGATVAASGPVTVAGSASLSAGSLTGAGTAEVTGALVWSNGRMSGTGTTHVAPGATLSIANTTTHLYLDAGRQLSNDGTVTWSPGNGYGITAAPGVVLRNAGLWQVTGNVSTGIYSDGAAGQPPVLRNLAGGTFRRTSGTGTATLTVQVANDGLVDAATGGVRLSGGGDGIAHGGTFGPGAVLDGGTFALDAATLDGAGVAGATVRAAGPVTVGPGTTSFSAGLLNGTGTVHVTGGLTWTGGRMAEAGITRVAPGATLSVAHTSTALYLDSGRSIVNEGTMTWSPSSGYGLDAGADVVIRNAGSWQLQGASSTTLADTSAGGTPPLVLNTGTLVRSGTGGATFQVPFDNQGTVRVDGGALYLDGRLLNYASATETLTGGTFAAHGGTLRLGVPRITTNASTLVVDAPSATLADATGGPAVRDLSRITANGELTVAGVALSTSARLTNAGRVVLGAGGSLTAGGGFVQAAGSTLLDDPGAHLAAGAGQDVAVTGGELAGVGTVDSPVTVTGGTVSPGRDVTPGTLTVAGSYSAGPAATLLVDVATIGADRLAAGDVALGGTLRLRTAAGVVAVDGTRHQVVTHAARTGRFAGVTGDPGPGWAYLLEHEPSAVAAVVRPASARESGGSVAIDSGAAYATSRAVTLSIVAPASAVEMRIGNDAAPTGAFQDLSGTVSWSLADLDGTRTVYVQFRDGAGNESVPVSATVVLDRRAARATITVPSSTTGALVVTFDEAVSGVTTGNVLIRSAAGAVPATVTCAAAGGATVDCATGLVRTVTLRPTVPLAPGVAYTAWIDPAGAPALVRDRAGNATAATSASFTLGL